jgi:hypothetical protein
VKSKLGRRLLIIFGICIVIFVLLAVVLILWLELPYHDAKAKLISETNLLHIAPGNQASQAYRSGICLDNCPELTTTYQITPTPLGQERAQIASQLKSSGYSFSSPTTGDIIIMASEGKFQLNLGFGGSPLSTSLLNSNINDTQTINNLVLVLDYNP